MIMSPGALGGGRDNQGERETGKRGGGGGR